MYAGPTFSPSRAPSGSADEHLREKRSQLMQIAMVGLGRMGANMVRRLMRGGHRCVVFDRSADTVKQLLGEGGSAEQGYLHCGPSGAGHFVKMVHNGIEYGLMQAYAEGFDIMRGATSKELPQEMRYDLNLADISELWRRGSVVGSWLLDLTAMALTENPSLSSYTGFVQDSGEGRWTIVAAI